MTCLFLLCGSACADAGVTVEPSLGEYMLRVGVALVVFALVAYLVVRFSGRNGRAFPGKQLALIERLPLGRETVYAVRCGPDIVVFVSGAGGARLLGKWPEERWNGEGIHEATE